MSESKVKTQAELKNELKSKQSHTEAKKTIKKNEVKIKLVRLARALPGTVTDSIMTQQGAILDYDAEKMYLTATLLVNGKNKTYIIFPSNIAYIEIE